ncbi:zinc-binding alcohol dehydrogenase family protein [Streptomyces sp. NPDC048002]|uniref:quinone oxidoreductase family protein n=1 Tax=Streptomyces sp. NPDC048002 TaxID=3154344 RepID=UPI0033F853A4
MRHEQPYVPGIECTGIVEASDHHTPGTLVYAECHPSPAEPGCFADLMVARDTDVLRLPEGVDPVEAVAVGNSGATAYLALVGAGGLHEGDRVLVLGATGTLGQVAVQIARSMGAHSIVAVGRNAETLALTGEFGANATIRVTGTETEAELRERFTASGAPFDLVLDGMYGIPLQAALHVCAPGAHVVNIANPAGATAVLNAGLLRSGQLTITAFASYRTPLADKRAALEWLWKGLAAERITVRVRTVPLDALPQEWGQERHPGVKTVVLPAVGEGP